MGSILARIPDSAKSASTGVETIRIIDYINKVQDDRHEQLMMLCGGDVNQYEALKKMSVADYLIKLEKVVGEIVALTKK